MSCKQLLLNFRNTKNIFQNKFVNNLKPLQRHLSATVLNKNIIEVKPDGDNCLKFPGVWLRDNCQCSECFHTQTKSREISWDRFNPNIHVKNLSAPSKNSILIEWNDSHKSTFDLDWLRERDFSESNQQRYIDEVYKPTPKLWSKDQFQEVTRKFKFNDVLNNDSAFLAWLEALAIEGFAIIENAPKDISVARQLAERIGYIKKTTYGEEFAVTTKFDTSNYAYLMTPLPLHSDMPYFEYMPGINILHFLMQSHSAGGANLMTDAFYIAAKLQKYYPEYFDVLTRVPVDWYDIGQDSGMTFHNIWRAPVICLDADGRFHRINHNTPKRDSHFTVPLDIVALWYEAYDKFIELINAEAVEFKIDTGNVFTFNNTRMLHGRTAFNDSPDNQRHLVGAYVDWDTIYSKIRLLRAQKK